MNTPTCKHSAPLTSLTHTHLLGLTYKWWLHAAAQVPHMPEVTGSQTHTCACMHAGPYPSTPCRPQPCMHAPRPCLPLQAFTMPAADTATPCSTAEPPSSAVDETFIRDWAHYQRVLEGDHLEHATHYTQVRASPVKARISGLHETFTQGCCSTLWRGTNWSTRYTPASASPVLRPGFLG